jgi:hypothetical protein
MPAVSSRSQEATSSKQQVARKNAKQKTKKQTLMNKIELLKKINVYCFFAAPLLLTLA